MEKTLQLPAGIKKRGLTRAQREARRAYMIILPYYIYIAFWSLLPLLIGFF